MRIETKCYLLICILFAIIQADWVKVATVPINGDQKINALSIGFDSTGLKKAIFVGLDSGVFYSTDTGYTWVSVPGSPKNIRSLADNVAAGTLDSGFYDWWGRVWRSDGLAGLGSINAISLPGNLFLLGTNTGVYCNVLNTKNPSLIGLSNYKINAIATTLYNWNLALNTGYGYIYAGTDSGVYLSNYFMQSNPTPPFVNAVWIQKNNGLPSKNISCLISALHPSSVSQDTNYVLAGTSLGVYLSRDKAENWISFNEGLTDKNVTALTYKDGVLSYNFVATFSNNKAVLWKRPLSEIASVSSSRFAKTTLRTEMSIFSNSILRYTIVTAGPISIRVFDVQGGIVLSEKLQEQGIGEHTYSLAKLKMLTGNYVLEFSAGQNVIRKAFVIVR